MTNALPQTTYIADEPDDAVRRLLIGPSRLMRDVRHMVRTVAPSDAPVLLGGPTGSGKDVAARAIHAASVRRSGPFIAVNCGAIPAELIESELFGHERGAFTGASERRIGRFERASGGTLFLDEIGDMPLAAQVRLLRVLEDGVFERVGGTTPLRFDGRIIAATHCDLSRAVCDRQFRDDLWFRLAVVTIDLPSLADRCEDMAELVTTLSRALATPALWSDGAVAALAAHDWPGNVRELRSVLVRAALFHPPGLGPVEPHHVPDLIDQRRMMRGAASGRDNPSPDPDLRALLMAVERRRLSDALHRAEGVVANAARIVGINRTTFVEKMRRHGLTRDGTAGCDPQNQQIAENLQAPLNPIAALPLSSWQIATR